MRWLLCLAAVAPFVSEIAVGLAFGRKTSFETRRIGRARRDALDVLSGSSDTKDIRRAETAWRQAWTKAQVAPPIQEAVVAIRAYATCVAVAAVASPQNVCGFTQAWRSARWKSTYHARESA